ncbi:uncharacterized LOC128706665 homolog [Ochotona princeps]|uniref:uncharacterized LOC128706665 homolog n=1 Tax=Ochotona princeps TaxID=9978 RepID=UPI002714AA80|nr:uncharacterized LOC128706665 homolog [Ochotona princeps]XP_058535479.1 uncharacterized LOC128706665 homolog [Ochotona princeps]
MSLHTLWKDYKVVIVMVPLVGLIHLGWHRIRSSPIFQVPSRDGSPEPDSLALAGLQKSPASGK